MDKSPLTTSTKQFQVKTGELKEEFEQNYLKGELTAGDFGKLIDKISRTYTDLRATITNSIWEQLHELANRPLKK